MCTSFKHADLFYNDYKWSARADHDNPKYIYGTDAAELNRTEGYEVLYFINSLAITWNWDGDLTQAYQNLEKIIRSKVPSNIRTHGEIKNWIAQRYQEI